MDLDIGLEFARDLDIGLDLGPDFDVGLDLGLNQHWHVFNNASLPVTRQSIIISH